MDFGRLRERLGAVDYTVEGVLTRLGSTAHAALHRNETTPAQRVLGEDDGPLATLIRLFLLQVEVPAEAVDRALPDLVRPLLSEGILARDNGHMWVLVDIRPYGDDEHDFWVIADLTPGLDGTRPTIAKDYVLGVNSAATTLAQLTVRRPVERAFDLGTGCGVQALHLASHAGTIVASDVNPRALSLARKTAALNDVALDIREGSLFEPVAGERFDLVVSNPPFVISPRGELTYRESGHSGDELSRLVVQGLAPVLVDGGVGQILANWLHLDGESWADRLAGWLDGSGCDAWVIQREVIDPPSYVELWLKDAGVHGTPSYGRLYDEWLSWFDSQQVTGIGFGWITVRRTTSTPVLRFDDWPGEIAQPFGAEVARWLDAIDLIRSYDEAALLEARPTVAGDVHQEQIGPPGAEDPAHIVLKRRSGLCKARPVDSVEAGFAGACDGDLSVGQISDALAEILAEPSDALRRRLLELARELLEDGFLVLEVLEA